MKPPRNVAVLAIAMALACGPAAAAEAPSGPELIAGPLDASGDFGADDKVRLSVSAIGCSGEQCVIVFDEGRSARFARLTRTAYEAMAAPLVLRAGDPEDELDTEGAAIGGDNFYVTGSHARARKEMKAKKAAEQGVAADPDGRFCKPHPDARGLYRFPLDATGLPVADAKPEEPTGGGLLAALEGTPLKDAIDHCLTLGKGLNVEGLAFKDGKLFFGFRGPKPSGEFAYVASADADALFGASPPQAAILKVSVGEGRAIRDMLAVKDGFLVLVGPDDIEANAGKAYSLIHWTGEDGAGVVDLGNIPTKDKTRPESAGCKDETTKPEALSATETPEGWRAVILSDGMCDGGPMWLDVKRH